MMTTRRAFAMPLVILLALVAALAGTLILELQSNATSSVNRQVRVYEDHHLVAGIRELMDQWLLTGGGDIAGRLEDDGRAFELDLPQGKSVTVYLEDAQGTVLRDLSAVGGAQARLLLRVINQLELSAAPPAPPPLPPQDGYGDELPPPPPVFRGVGPVPVSVNSASDEVLEAIAAASDNPSSARALMRRIRAKARPGSPMTAEDLNSAFAAVTGLTQAQSRQLGSLLTAQPELWRMTIETRYGSLSTARVERSAALIQVPVAGQNLGATGVVVLSWEDAQEQTNPPGAAQWPSGSP